MSDSLTSEQVAERIASFSDEDLLRIAYMSHAWNTGLRGWDPEDLVQEAIVRILDGRRHVPANINFLYGITQIIRSIADERRQLDLVMASEEEGGDPADENDDIEQLEEARIFDHLESMLDPTSNAARVLRAYRQGHSEEETCALLSMDKRKYAAARKRINRAILTMRSGVRNEHQ